MSCSSEIQIEDLSTEKKYFTQIPNIILKMHLGPYLIAYYTLLKSVAGEKLCFMKVENLALMLGCSSRKIQKMNAILSKPFPILNGKSLIKITYRKDDKGENLPNLIQLTDIWVENIDVLRSDKPIEKPKILEKKPKNKKIISGEPYSPGGEPYSPGGEPGAPIIRTIEEDVSKKNDNVSVDRSFDECNSIVSFDPTIYTFPDGNSMSLQMKRSIAKYSPKDMQKLRANIIYFEEQLKKGFLPKTTYERMLQDCIKNNYASKQSNAEQNLLYVRWMKEQYKLSNVRILRTVAQLKKNSKEPAESLSFSLPVEVFSSALENFIRNQKE